MAAVGVTSHTGSGCPTLVQPLRHVPFASGRLAFPFLDPLRKNADRQLPPKLGC